MFVVFIVLYAWSSRKRAMYYLILISVFIFMMSFFKLFYHEPRPYMVVAEIKVYDCSTEFGNPSGHTMSVGSIMVLLFLEYFYTNDHGLQNERGCWYLFCLLADVGVMLIVGFSRLYNGVHTLD